MFAPTNGARGMANWETKRAVGPIQANCWVLRCPRTGDVAVIDPGEEPESILEVINSSAGGARVSLLLMTHAHFDHIGGARELKERLQATQPAAPEIALHPGDELLYANLRRQGEAFGIACSDPAPVTRWLRDEQSIEVGALRLKVLHSPGHSPGGVCFLLEGNDALGVQQTVYTGDTLFRQSIGRTDLPGGDHRALLASIRTRLMVLDGAVRVCPGHGETSTIAYERDANPWVVEG